jgi:hypothetical protein
MQSAMRIEVGKGNGLPKKLNSEVEIIYWTVSVTVVECISVTPPAPVAVALTVTV